MLSSAFDILVFLQVCSGVGSGDKDSCSQVFAIRRSISQRQILIFLLLLLTFSAVLFDKMDKSVFAIVKIIFYLIFKLSLSFHRDIASFQLVSGKSYHATFLVMFIKHWNVVGCYSTWSIRAFLSSTRYRLRGVIVHSGQANGGHYYSFIRSEEDSGRWYKFDDIDVMEWHLNKEVGFMHIYIFIISARLLTAYLLRCRCLIREVENRSIFFVGGLLMKKNSVESSWHDSFISRIWSLGYHFQDTVSFLGCYRWLNAWGFSNIRLLWKLCVTRCAIICRWSKRGWRGGGKWERARLMNA